MLTKPAIRVAHQLSTLEREEKLHVFKGLLAKLQPFIKAEAAKRAYKRPSSYFDESDLETVGVVQTWVAAITWDPNKGASLENWARRKIWTNMNVVMGGVYQLKRVPRVTGEDGTEVTVQHTSLFTDNGDGALLYETLKDDTFPDPVGVLIADELYGKAREELLKRSDRVAAAVLRLLVYPDGELLQLCVEDTRNNKRKVRLTNRNIARRLGVSTCRVATAKAVVRSVFKEYSEGD